MKNIPKQHYGHAYAYLCICIFMHMHAFLGFTVGRRLLYAMSLCARMWQNKRPAFGNGKCREKAQSECITDAAPCCILMTCAISTETDFEEYAWDTFLLVPMNAGCMAFVVQTRDLKFAVRSFARLAHSPRTTHRASRKYLLLPSAPLPEKILEANIREVYHMRQMGFMPDLVIARLVTEQNVTYTGCSSGESHECLAHSFRYHGCFLSLKHTTYHMHHMIQHSEFLHFGRRVHLPVSYHSRNNAGLWRDYL
jgi:hypothetical protein